MQSTETATGNQAPKTVWFLEYYCGGMIQGTERNTREEVVTLQGEWSDSKIGSYTPFEETQDVPPAEAAPATTDDSGMANRVCRYLWDSMMLDPSPDTRAIKYQAYELAADARDLCYTCQTCHDGYKAVAFSVCPNSACPFSDPAYTPTAQNSPATWRRLLTHPMKGTR